MGYKPKPKPHYTIKRSGKYRSLYLNGSKVAGFNTATQTMWGGTRHFPAFRELLSQQTLREYWVEAYRWLPNGEREFVDETSVDASSEGEALQTAKGVFEEAGTMRRGVLVEVVRTRRIPKKDLADIG